MAEIKLVKMVNADGKTADVPPSEVENYQMGGYEIVEQSKPAPKPKK